MIWPKDAARSIWRDNLSGALTMPLSLYEVSVPVVTRGLLTLAALLRAGETFAAERGIAPADMLGKRLIEDMFPLTRQVQSACDTAKFCGARLAGITPPSDPDTETSFAELQERIARTLQFLGDIEVNAMNGREDAEVVLRTGAGETAYTARAYLLQFAIPNFFFHLTTAYDLLRMQGVPLGKLDYLGNR
jgi:uncharacterized protein